MQTKQILTCAVLSAAILPMASVHAGDHKDGKISHDSSASMSSDRMGGADAEMSSMDVGEFRGNLEHLKEIFTMIQENSRLALASQDPLVASMYQQRNQHLSHRSLGLLDQATRNWKRIDTPYVNEQGMGSKDMARFAAESDDTAFVRNTVSQLQATLMSDKLNGRDPNITHQMMEMLDAAIARTNNANYRVSSAYSRHRMQFSEFKMSEPTPAPAGSSEQVATTTTRRKLWQEATIEHENLPPRNQVAQAPAPTTEEVMTQETTPEPSYSGSPELPKTGGAPEMLVLLGSSLMGAGGLLLRRRR